MADDQSSKGRPMTSKEQEFFARNQEWHTGGNSRGMAMKGMTAPTQNLNDNKGIQQKPPAPGKIPQLRKQELSLMNCELAINDPTETWQSVQDVVEKMQSIDPLFYSQEKLAIGNFYQSGNFCEFHVGLCQSAESQAHLLDFKRMSGDGFVMDSFFRTVRNSIKEDNPDLLMETDTDGGDTEDLVVFDDYSDSDEEENDSDDSMMQFLQIGGPLNLKYDPNLVNTWIEDVETRHIEDRNHRMGLMAHNAQTDENRAIIIEQGGQRLQGLIRNIFSENMNAALCRNTSVLLREMSKQVDLGEDMINCIFEAMVFWVPGNQRREAFRVTESRETVMNLACVIHNLVSRDVWKTDNLKEQVKTIVDGASDTIKDFLLKARENDIDGNYSEQIGALEDILD